MRKFYVDTSIWRDYFEDRSNGIRPLGDFAFQFLNNCRKHKCIVVYSEPLLFELKDFPRQLIEEMFSPFKELLLEVPVSKKQMNESKEIAKNRKLPFNDVLQAIIARDNEAIMITRDKHFNELLDIVGFKVPEEIIFP
ncbi:MAG: hypothetical protein ABIE23_03480 [archaeon]